MKRKQTLVIVDIQPSFSPGPLPVGSMDAATVEALARLVGTAYEPISPRATPSPAWPGLPLPATWLDHRVKPHVDTAEALRLAVQDALDNTQPVVFVAGLAPSGRFNAIDPATKTALDGVVLRVKDHTED